MDILIKMVRNVLRFYIFMIMHFSLMSDFGNNYAKQKNMNVGLQ